MPLLGSHYLADTPDKMLPLAAGFGAVGLLLAAATPKPLKHEIVDRPEVIRATKAALQSTGVRVFDVEAFTTGIFFYKEKPTVAHRVL